jgi:hypothetical protein
MEITTSNGYAIIDKVEDPRDPGFFRILVKRDECPFPEAPFVVALKDFNRPDYDGWAYALSYDLTLEKAVELLNK